MQGKTRRRTCLRARQVFTAISAPVALVIVQMFRYTAISHCFLWLCPLVPSATGGSSLDLGPSFTCHTALRNLKLDAGHLVRNPLLYRVPHTVGQNDEETLRSSKTYYGYQEVLYHLLSKHPQRRASTKSFLL